MRGGAAARLDGVSAEIHQGVTAVLGPSGAGKTSLLNLLVRFEKPDRGKVKRQFASGLYALPVFWVPQDGGLWPRLTVRRHLEAVAAESSAQDREDLLRAFDIEQRASSYPDELSMGERSRLAVARAIAASAAVLVMDEPLAHVDQARVARYWDVIREHMEHTRASLVFATHTPGAVLAEAQRVLCLKEGRLIYDGEVEELYARPADQDQAECMGPVNWLAPEDAQLWLDGAVEGRSCYRPEHVRIEPAAEEADDRALVVESSRSRGAVLEVMLRHRKAHEVRRFHCCAGAERVERGGWVILKVVLALLLAVILGCDKQSVPELKVREVNYWSMPPDGTKIPAPRSVAVGRDDEVIVIDTAGRVLVFGTDGKVKRQWRMPDTEEGAPEDLCVLEDGRIVVSDTHYYRVAIFDQQGELLNTFGKEGRGEGEFFYPVGIVKDDEDNVYVCEYGGNDRVQKFTPDGKFLFAFGSFGTGPGQFQRPSGMARTERNVYVADAINNRVLIFADDGEFVGLLGEGPIFRFPYDVALGGDRSLYVVEYQAGRVSKIGLDGRLLGRYGSVGTGEGKLRTPWGVAFDAANARLLVADTGNRRMVELKL